MPTKKHLFCGRCGCTDLSVYYPTPEAVGRQVIDLAKIHGERVDVLEPSAGTGNLAELAVAAGATVDCIELQDHFAVQLRETGLYREVWSRDFLSLPPRKCYDRIIMNPPFERGADMMHVSRAVEWLKPGGILVAIVSAMTGHRRRRADKQFAVMLKEHSAHTVPLPAGAFASVGTNVACVLIRIQIQ